METKEILARAREMERLQEIVCEGNGDTLTDDELRLAFKESAGDLPIEFVRNRILPYYFTIDYEGDILFSGQNCDDCAGWDGLSRRCNCGNRRVSWTIDHNFPYAEAY